MGTASGGASAPPRPRDARGRFVSVVRVSLDEQELLRTFLRDGVVQFPDPFYSLGVFTMELGKSMKGYPVRLFHSHYGSGAWHRCPGSFNNYGDRSPYGHQLAISPNGFYGWPGDKWDGEWSVRGMAALLLHLAHSQNLEDLNCGDQVGRFRVGRLR